MKWLRCNLKGHCHIQCVKLVALFLLYYILEEMQRYIKKAQIKSSNYNLSTFYKLFYCVFFINR